MQQIKDLAQVKTIRVETLARWLCLGLVAAGLSGCAHPSQVGITSNKLNAYHADIKRLLVLTDLGKAIQTRGGDQEAAFTSAFTASLGTCGIDVKVQKHDPLALQDETKQAVQNFAPDTFLSIGWKTEQSVNTVAVQTVLVGSMIDLKTKRLVWKAEINFVPASNAGQTLAASIIDRLKLETILGSSCPTPIVPKV